MDIQYPHDEDDKHICLKCGFEIDRPEVLQNRRKGEFPKCPRCGTELSFKDSSLLKESQHPAVPVIIFLLLFAAALFGVYQVFSHFQTRDGRKLQTSHALPGQTIYGGKTRARVPGDWALRPYSYMDYWKGAYGARIDTMIREEHWYVYQRFHANMAEIAYYYADSTGKKNRYVFSVPLYGNDLLVIPAIPYIRGSKSTRLKLSAGPSGDIYLQQV